MSALELDVLDRMDKVLVDDWGQCAQDDGFGALRPHVRAGLLNARHAVRRARRSGRGRQAGPRAGRRAHSLLAPRPCDDGVALAALIYRRAVEEGLGTRIAYR